MCELRETLLIAGTFIFAIWLWIWIFKINK
jgi:hypothetical protein